MQRPIHFHWDTWNCDLTNRPPSRRRTQDILHEQAVPCELTTCNIELVERAALAIRLPGAAPNGSGAEVFVLHQLMFAAVPAEPALPWLTMENVLTDNGGGRSCAANARIVEFGNAACLQFKPSCVRSLGLGGQKFYPLEVVPLSHTDVLLPAADHPRDCYHMPRMAVQEGGKPGMRVRGHDALGTHRFSIWREYGGASCRILNVTRPVARAAPAHSSWIIVGPW
jgi:hypothetical protein